MSQPQDSVPDEASFEGLVDLGSIPPPKSEPGGSDVHAARTTVARVSESFLDELKRGRAAAAEGAFTNEAPTKPKGLMVLATSTMPPEPELPLGNVEVTIDISEIPPPLEPRARSAHVETAPVAPPAAVAAPEPAEAAPRVARRRSLGHESLRWLASFDVGRSVLVLASATIVAALAVAALFFWAGHR